MNKIKFNDLKTIGYSFKVSTNDVEDKYITYTVSDYNEDVKDAAGVSCTQIILSVSNRKEKVVLLYTNDFLNEKMNYATRLSDGIDVLVVF
jgi:hypothetical protein